jgi:hypothetical protein
LRTADIDLWLAKTALDAAAIKHRLVEDAQSAEKPQDKQPAVEALVPLASGHRKRVDECLPASDQLPTYLRFLIEMVPLLGGRDRIADRKKANIEVEIEARWRPELGQRSQNLVGAMATILRPPEAQRGGAKPMRAPGISVSREGWNGSTLANKAAAEIEAVSGETV